MRLDEVLTALFPSGHKVERGAWGTLHGSALVEGQGKASIVGICGGTPLGADGALLLADHVLATVKAGDHTPIIVLIDGASQNMARRDELLGLNEYLAHLVKCLTLAALQGHCTVSVLFGGVAAGAFVAAGLSSQSVVALPGAAPSVMDLPSMARVTKLPLEKLEALAKATPIFAPGIQPLFAMGALLEIWAADPTPAPRLAALLQRSVATTDCRDQLGFERNGRLLARTISEQVVAEAGTLAGS